ncbi:hypothetical protein BDZ45DRAFT_411047 [Acephala macrosclerotiorum]|nr:hypothetical protein BDZ45DRAFT_411047 [Acephala macrosclerotiorum]
MYDAEATQGLLSSLRDEAGKLSHLQHGTTLESLFTDPIVCHMASSTAPSHHGWTTGVKVIIKHLATTRSAQSDAASAKVDFPEPGLDVCQLDEFIDLAPRMKKLENVGQYEQGIISATLKIADYLGILFNWNANTVSFQQGSCGCTRAEAKNIVLETAYAMAHRIQDLMKKMVFEVNKSVTNRQDPKHDPATISCALWIIYSSLNKFQKLAWDAKSLQNLKKFLNGLHERAGGAIASIEHYRREVAFNVCCKKSANLQAYKNLVVAKKVPRAATAFTYERFRPVSYMLGMMPTFSHEQSYTDVLENSVADNDYLSLI